MNKLSLLDENNIFDAPVPGQSLTDTPKQWQWENPPEMTDPIEVYESIKESMNRPVARETIEKLLYVGVSVETIVNGLSLKGFSDGKFSPDVAELIKIPLAFQVTAIADRAGITPNIINVVSASTITGVTDATLYGAKSLTSLAFCAVVKLLPVFVLIDM